MTYDLENITRFPGASHSGVPAGAISHVSVDSRSLNNGQGTIYFALVGPHHDGHDFIAELHAKGVRHFVVSQPVDLADAFVIRVTDTLEALQFFAARHRQKFDIPVIAITGSNGKTIVKEWLNYLLGPEYNIARSPKSYNSQTGVPLSILGIGPSHNLAIIEAGVSEPGEMQRLAEIISPTIGVLTNLGAAHDEGFTGPAEKKQEKLKLFRSAQRVIGRAQDLMHTGLPVTTWGFGRADVNFSVIGKDTVTQIEVRWAKETFTFNIPFTDAASVENACTCVTLMLHLHYAPEVIARRMPNLFPVSMRLSIKNGIGNCALIDDSYSLDLQSLRIALDFLESQKQHRRKTVILSDIVQSGIPAEALYVQASEMLRKNRIGRVIGIGPQISAHAGAFSNIELFPSTDDFLAKMPAFSSETILIKGARQFHFERIAGALEEKTHETVLEINLNAVSHNLSFYRSKLRPGCKLMVMVKAFGYGNGGFEIAKLLEHHNCDYLGVAFADEGITLRQAGISIPIMVLNPELTSFGSIIQHRLEPEIYSLRGLKAFIAMASEKNVEHYPIHIKLDTGMHRLGFTTNDLTELILVLKDTKRLAVKSIFSHLATSDDPTHRDFTLTQIERFEVMSGELMRALEIDPIRHILNTSGITHFPEAQYDMVRLGIGLYGISNDPSEQPMLQNVGTLKSIISQLHKIPVGDSVGYGRRFVAKRPTVIATVPIGYADGISRHWGNEKGYVVIGGQKAPIVGSVCMDMLMVDVTGIDCREGDPVILLGEHPHPNEMARTLETIPYEILTSISQRVKRTFFRE